MTRTYFKTREAEGDQWYYFSLNAEMSYARKVVLDLARRISGADCELEQVTEEEYLTSLRTFARFQDFAKVIEGSDDKTRWLQVGCDDFKSLYFRTSREVMEAVQLVMEYTSNSMAGPDGAREVIKYLKKKVAAREKFEDKLRVAEITAQGPALDPSED
jgi:hypothetical protein